MDSVAETVEPVADPQLADSVAEPQLADQVAVEVEVEVAMTGVYKHQSDGAPVHEASTEETTLDGRRENQAGGVVAV